MKKVINFVGFQLAWFGAVFGAAGGHLWLGPAAVLLWLAVYALLSGRPRFEMQIALIALLMGLLADSLLIGTGVYTPRGLIGGWPLTPPWMLSLWINFGTLVNGSLSWLKGRYLLGAFLGAWGGPAAYYSGHRAGALTFHPPLIPHLVFLGIAWAMAVPLLFYLAKKIENKIYTR
jgi:Protein of unknown function (DUF2878)